MWAFRCAFFRDCRDISRWDIQCEIAKGLGADIGAIEELIHSGVAFARLATDYQDADKMRIEGSPSFVLNEGRQKLYGNVGFRLIAANIKELFRAPARGRSQLVLTPSAFQLQQTLTLRATTCLPSQPAYPELRQMSVVGQSRHIHDVSSMSAIRPTATWGTMTAVGLSARVRHADAQIQAVPDCAS